VRGRLANKRAFGKIGGGGPALDLNTVNGTITLHQVCGLPL